MKNRCIALISAGIIIGAANAQDAPALPDLAEALLQAAQETGDPDEIAAVARAAQAVFPDNAEAIDARAAQLITQTTPAREQTQQASMKGAGPRQGEKPVNGDYGLFAIAPWDGKLELSALTSSGNSENTSIGVLIDAARAEGDFTHNIDAYFNLGESDGITKQKRWGGAYQLDYNFTDRSFAYGRFSYEEDQFSGFDYRLFAGAGLGHFIFMDEKFKWKASGGPGFRYSPIDDTLEIDKEFALFAASETDWIIREGVIFEQDFSTTWTEASTTLKSISSLSTKLWNSISTGLSFEYRYETDPPPGREKTDTIAKASLIYGF